MTIFLTILVLVTFVFDFGMNRKEAFTKKKRRLYFVVSNLVWYSVSGLLLYLSVSYPELQIWQMPYSLLVIIIIFPYFVIHTLKGMIIYNCQEDPMFSKQMNNSNFEKTYK